MSDINFCPYCGSENIKFNGFILCGSKLFRRRQNFYRCHKCKKRISEIK